MKDKSGRDYSFVVKESFKNENDVNNDNWTIVKSTPIVDGKAKIDNAVVVEENKLGTLTIKKNPLGDRAEMTPAHWAYYKVMEACNGHEYERVGEKDERWIMYKPEWVLK